MTTLDTMTEAIRVALASRAINDSGGHMSRHLAQAAIEASGLEQALPCGYETPLGSNGLVSFDAYMGTPSDARAYAAAILRACDEAEAMPGVAK